MNICNLGASSVLFNWKIIKVILYKEEKKATAQKAQRQQTLSYPKVSQNDKNHDCAGHRRGTLILTRAGKAVCNLKSIGCGSKGDSVHTKGNTKLFQSIPRGVLLGAPPSPADQGASYLIRL